MRNCETLHTKLFEPEATNVVGLAAPAAASISSSSSCSIGSVRFVGDRTENTTAASAASAVLFYSATIIINYHVCAVRDLMMNSDLKRIVTPEEATL